MLRKLRRDLAEFLELPLDVSLDLPRITIIGDLGVFVENHRGLVQYSPQQIVVGVGSGQIVVNGESLQIEEVKREDLMVRGAIRNVRLST